jgi:hypothetical protein
MTYEELLSAFTQMALVVVGVPALAFAILGGLASAARSKHHSAESGLWFGARLGVRIMPYIAIPYACLAFWVAYPHMVLLFVALWGFGDGAVRPNRAFRRRYRRDVRWLRRETAPTARRAEEALRRTVDAAGDRAKTAGKAAPRQAWRGVRWAGRHAKKATDTDPPSAMGWLFNRHRDDDSPGRAARRRRVEARIADRLMEGHEPRERPTLDQRLARWADRIGLHPRHDDT